MEEGGSAAGPKRWGGLLRQGVLAVFGRGIQSLPSRIIVSVFAAALVTSLVVTWNSTHSIGGFLRKKIDENFPSVLRGTAQSLDLWYAQRQLDVRTFARSATVAENIESLGPAAPPARRERARTEVGKYLAYVLERFPQYEALFLLDPDGGRLLSVGVHFDLPSGLVRSLTGVSDARVSDFVRLGGRMVQMASSPVSDGRGRVLGSFHAVVGSAAVEEVLAAEDLGESGAIYVVGSDGRYILHSRGSLPEGLYERPLPAEGEAPAVSDYVSAAGQRVVGGAVRFSRYGWSLVVEEAYDEAFAPVVSLVRKNLGINLAIVVIFGLIALQIARSIVRPVHALSEGARRIAEGDTGVTIRHAPSRDEIGVLIRVFNEMSSRLEANQSELERNRAEIEEANRRLVSQNERLRQVNEMLEQLSITDGLTKLHNHRFFQEHLRREMKRTRRSRAPLSLILIDIDNFKALNDRYGHACGDVVLQRIGEVLNEVVRETDLLARYGGEEFALLASQTDLQGATALAEKLRLAVAQTPIVLETDRGEARVHVTVSIGVSTFAGDAKAFFNDADRALYRAKAQGKDCVVAAGDG